MRILLFVLALVTGLSGQNGLTWAADPAVPPPAAIQPAASPPVSHTPQPDLAAIGEDIPDWQARWELARLLSYVKRYDESLAQYRKLLQEKPNLQEARIEMASVLSWTGRVDEALALLHKIPQQGLNRNGRLALADIFIAGRDYPAAEALLWEELQASPDDDPSRLKLAEILSWSKRYDDSLKEYAILLKHQPDDQQLRRKYAYVLIWAGKREQAVDELRKSLKE